MGGSRPSVPGELLDAVLGEPGTWKGHLGLELDPPRNTTLEVAGTLGQRVRRAPTPAVGWCGAGARHLCLGLPRPP